ncbi:hypothetical protein [Aliidiomarina maris]|uniref:5-bromo-4-chloroindolyl phosphate hydrolysis protein n=1 Tax=Aliidiomarina maris TaxID=531312 RepID=A0A327X6T2_9GAMM|nr:hypothetical protein [Aliidiomarina maris]RAK01603.1 hypothetical protein B0I24_101226 [Aliidiomarina maris]RUO28429.1 hypothetical protein CWE07_01080 [Aliidiomarina maris]
MGFYKQWISPLLAACLLFFAGIIFGIGMPFALTTPQADTVLSGMTAFGTLLLGIVAIAGYMSWREQHLSIRMSERAEKSLEALIPVEEQLSTINAIIRRYVDLSKDWNIDEETRYKKLNGRYLKQCYDAAIQISTQVQVFKSASQLIDSRKLAAKSNALQKSSSTFKLVNSIFLAPEGHESFKIESEEDVQLSILQISEATKSVKVVSENLSSVREELKAIANFKHREHSKD